MNNAGRSFLLGVTAGLDIASLIQKKLQNSFVGCLAWKRIFLNFIQLNSYIYLY